MADQKRGPTADLETLRKRSRVFGALRSYMESHDYWEVDTPVLSRESIVDAHLDPFELPVTFGDKQAYYLQTSPELHMKQIVAAGAERIYQLGHVFRSEERGQRHNPEFSMLEWYAVGSTLVDQMNFVESMLTTLSKQDFSKIQKPAYKRYTYEELFREVLGISIYELSDQELQELIKAETEISDTVLDSSLEADRDFLYQLLLTECVEPWLANQAGVFVSHYPASQSALARISPEDPRVSERFELYWEGVELCNGYRELLDPNILEQRTIQQNDLRQNRHASVLRGPDRLIAAMQQGLPDCSGVALGVDRLLMVMLGFDQIDQVIAFPWEVA